MLQKKGVFIGRKNAPLAPHTFSQVGLAWAEEGEGVMNWKGVFFMHVNGSKNSQLMNFR